jgi:hypothetical protein
MRNLLADHRDFLAPALTVLFLFLGLLSTELKSAVASAKDRNKVEHDRLKNLVVWYVDTPWWKRLFRIK